MKKILMFLALTVSFLGINSVNASSLEFEYNYSTQTNLDSLLNNEEYKKIVTELERLLFDFYESDYSTNYPYYIIQVNVQSKYIYTTMVISNQPCYFTINSNENHGYGITYLEDGTLLGGYITSENLNKISKISAYYNITDKLYVLPVYNEKDYNSNDVTLPNPGHYLFQGTSIFECNLTQSNYDIKIYTNHDSIIIHNFRDTGSDYILNSGDVYQVLWRDKNIYNQDSNLIEVNLNDYAYVALSLKDYKQDPFDVLMQVKGQYCITPVYNYGMTERKYILSGTQVERCSPYYDNYTSVRTSILANDLQNHSIYYLKAYDTSKDNYVKIDTTIFDVTLITEENKDNPYVTVNGKTYPTIPYDELTDTATKSEDEGYASGASEKFNFSDIFTAPLEFLKDIWDSILLVFDLITELLSLLPPLMQNFLYFSFMLAIAIGLIKIIL